MGLRGVMTREFIFPVQEEAYADDFEWIAEHSNGEIIRCKNCQYGEPTCFEDQIWCRNPKSPLSEDLYPREPNWFCANGIPKDGGER